MTDEPKPMWEKFEKLGEQEVRFRVNSGNYAGHKRVLALAWLEERGAASEAESRAIAIAFAREANELAREANDLARSANSIADAASRSAERSAVTALANTKIAKRALAVAIIAMLISFATMYVK